MVVDLLKGLVLKNPSISLENFWASRANTTLLSVFWDLVQFNLDVGNQMVDRVRRIMFGAGVSAASIINMRQILDKEGYKDALIVASSGFNPQKCHVMGAAGVPIDMVGTGSFLPATLTETYATADIISYGGISWVKVGREFLID